MKEGETQSIQSSDAVRGTSVLLPEASITVFSRDKETLEAAEVFEKDWRFARVVAGIEEGGIDSAIHAYQEFESPDLLIIQTEDIDDSFTDKLEELAAHCDEGTSAIVVGPVNDVNLYRTLIDMGVSDYLVKPLSADVIAEIAAKALIDKIGASDSRLIAYIGSKGGVGTSTLCQNSACAAARLLGQKTFIMDLCGGSSTMSIALGFEPVTTLTEAVRALDSDDEDSFSRMIVNPIDKLNVLASGGDAILDEALTASQIEDMIDLFMKTYPVVFIDLSGAPQDLQKVVLRRAHQICVVSTQNLISLRHARSLMQEVKDLRGGDDSNIELLINMQGQPGEQKVSKKDIEGAMDFEIAACVPFESKVFQVTDPENASFAKNHDGAAIVQQALLSVSQKILGHSVDTSDASKDSESNGFLAGLIGKIGSK